MQETNDRLLTQPYVGIVTGTVALAAVVQSWIAVKPDFGVTPIGEKTAALAVALTAALFLSYRFPIYVRHTIKIEMGSVPLYLMAVLLPAPIAALAAGAGIVAGEISVRKQRGLYPSDIATQAGRWMVVAMAGSLIAHLPASVPALHAVFYTLAAVILMAGDILTGVLSIAPITGERPGPLVVTIASGIGLPEAGQYFMGLMGAIVAMQDIWGTALLVLPVALLYRTCKRSKEMNDSTHQLLVRMAKTVDLRDPYTGGHSDRVYKLTDRLLRDLDVAGPEAHLIGTAARVHDIGKISIPDALLHKHEKLSPEEWAVMERHPAEGADLLARYPDFAAGADIVRHHHERWDGQGYPDRLAGGAIPFGARVIAVCDSFDAMTSDRPYRKGMTPMQAAAVLSAGSGTQWDPKMVDAFLRTFKDALAAEPDAQAGARTAAMGHIATV